MKYKMWDISNNGIYVIKLDKNNAIIKFQSGIFIFGYATAKKSRKR